MKTVCLIPKLFVINWLYLAFIVFPKRRFCNFVLEEEGQFPDLSVFTYVLGQFLLHAENLVVSEFKLKPISLAGDVESEETPTVGYV